MPDQAEVAQALVERLAEIVYPNGPSAPSITGNLIRIFRGWPGSAALDRDLAAGHVQISVFVDGAARDVTASIEGWKSKGPQAAPSLSWAVVDSTATLVGTPTTPQAVALVVDRGDAVHEIQPGDTLDSIAAELAVQIPGAQAVGAGVVIPGAWRLVGRSVVPQRVFREVGHQAQVIRVTFWCPEPGVRDVLARAVDTKLQTEKFIAVDGYAARLRWQGSPSFDIAQDENLYRRDIFYEFTFPITAEEIVPQAAIFKLQLGANELDPEPYEV
jgi:hypothetical protein